MISLYTHATLQLITREHTTFKGFVQGYTGFIDDVGFYGSNDGGVDAEWHPSTTTCVGLAASVWACIFGCMMNKRMGCV